MLRTFRPVIEDGEAVDEDGESVEDGKEKQPGLEWIGLKTMSKYIQFPEQKILFNRGETLL